MAAKKKRFVVLNRLPTGERKWLAGVLRDETLGGGLLIGAALIAFVMVNSPLRDVYETIINTTVGPASLNLNLTLSKWAADGVLALFFFVAGLELKHEFVLGQLRTWRLASVPVAAAVSGMIFPAIVFFALTTTQPEARPAWAVPIATDIAFALAVLAVAGRGLPAALRIFLLTLAIVDDIGAITVIAIFYTEEIKFIPLVIAIALLALYALLQRLRVSSAFIYVPLVLATWAATHESGVHATIAGVALGLLTRVKTAPGEAWSPAERLERWARPLSALVALPIFAFMAAGVPVVGVDIGKVLTQPLVLGVIFGLVVGKPIGVLVGTWAITRFTNAQLNKALSWLDIAAVGTLAGIGFTVSLLITKLAFPDSPDLVTSAKTGVLFGSILAALLAVVFLRLRSRTYAKFKSSKADPIPDVPYEPTTV